jgi:hypothetical protein
MSKAMDRFLDSAAPRFTQALKSNDPAQRDAMMDALLVEFLNVNISKRKPAAPKRKVRRGIGSY